MRCHAPFSPLTGWGLARYRTAHGWCTLARGFITLCFINLPKKLKYGTYTCGVRREWRIVLEGGTLVSSQGGREGGMDGWMDGGGSGEGEEIGRE